MTAARQQGDFQRRTRRLFVGILVVLLSVELLALIVEEYLAAEESSERQLLATAADAADTAKHYERASYLAVVALASSSWELLLAERREATELAERFDALAGRLSGEYGDVVVGVSGEGDDGAAAQRIRGRMAELAPLWQQLQAGQARLLRTNERELRDNPAVDEFRRAAGRLNTRLSTLVTLLENRRNDQIEILSRGREVVRWGTLVFTVLVALLAFQGLIAPFGRAARALQESREALRVAHDDLEQRVEARTQDLAQANRELQRQTATLETQTEVLQSVIDSMGEGLAVATRTGAVEIWNRQAQAMLGAQPSWLGDAASCPQGADTWTAHVESFHADQVTPIADGEFPIQRALHGESVDMDMFVKTAAAPDGIWLRWTARPVRAGDGDTDDGERRGAVAVFRDETARVLAEARLRQAHDELEQRVEERTRKLKQAQEQLVDSALAAGKAEVATNILHNVGNVLNGVNVLVHVVRERLGDKAWTSLPKLAGLIEANRADFSRFVRDDPRGVKLPDYVVQLAEAQQRELTEVLARVARLDEQIEHIKRIIQLQQEHAKSVSVVEDIAVVEVIHSALAINEAGLERHGIDITTDLAEVPLTYTSKNKILQILVNLISNAKYALADVPLGSRELCIELAEGPEGFVSIRVRDNGCGIEPGLETRIFQHGFSTRAEGHGFGLHASSLAAKQLGGELRVESAGVGEGACFTLEVPIVAASEVSSLSLSQG
ncbi:MAG: hypothetical protein Tsb0020_13050 [Haliangiales bacterium]